MELNFRLSGSINKDTKSFHVQLFLWISFNQIQKKLNTIINAIKRNEFSKFSNNYFFVEHKKATHVYRHRRLGKKIGPVAKNRPPKPKKLQLFACFQSKSIFNIQQSHRNQILITNPTDWKLFTTRNRQFLILPRIAKINHPMTHDFEISIDKYRKLTGIRLVKRSPWKLPIFAEFDQRARFPLHFLLTMPSLDLTHRPIYTFWKSQHNVMVPNGSIFEGVF